MGRVPFRRLSLAIACAGALACDTTTSLDRGQYNHAMIRGSVRHASGEAAPGAQIDFFGFAQRSCGNPAEGWLLGQATTSAQGTYLVRAQYAPMGRPIDVCIVVRARVVVATQVKEQTVLGPTIPFVAAGQVPDTVTVDVVLPP